MKLSRHCHGFRYVDPYETSIPLGHVKFWKVSAQEQCKGVGVLEEPHECVNPFYVSDHSMDFHIAFRTSRNDGK